MNDTTTTASSSAEIGALLHTCRCEQGFSIAEVAHQTRIPARILTELEKEGYVKEIGGTYSRGYLRAYAEFLGLSLEDEALALPAKDEFHYDGSWLVPGPKAGVLVTEEKEEGTEEEEPRPVRSGPPVGISALGGLAVAMVLLWGAMTWVARLDKLHASEPPVAERAPDLLSEDPVLATVAPSLPATGEPSVLPLAPSAETEERVAKAVPVEEATALPAATAPAEQMVIAASSGPEPSFPSEPPRAVIVEE